MVLYICDDCAALRGGKKISQVYTGIGKCSFCNYEKLISLPHDFGIMCGVLKYARTKDEVDKEHGKVT